MLRLDLKIGQSIKIGDAIVTLEDKSGRVAKLAIEAPQSVRVERVPQLTPASLAAQGITGKP
jgi:sRNA-binding carbon storage regulator CsrA